MKKTFKYMDWMIFIPYLFLCLFGVVMVYSASEGLTDNGMFANHFLLFQLIFFVVGLVFLLIFMHLKVKTDEKSQLILCALMFFMILVLIYTKYFGLTTNGASGWLAFGPFSIQPAEFCKPLLIFYFAVVLDAKQKHYEDFGLGKEVKSIWQQCVLPGIILLLIFVQPDTGGFAINLFIILVMILCCDGNLKSAIGWLLGFILGLLVVIRLFITIFPNAFNGSHSYKLQRIVSYVNPFRFMKTSGAQLVNSYYAMSNGGLFGVGLGNSMQKMGYLSEPNTDFIISIVSEEFGLIGILIILTVLGFLIIRIVAVGSNARTIRARVICFGTAAYLFIQTLFNAGGAVGLIPLTGVAFPFISYGGSSLLALSFCIGMVLKVSYSEKRRKAKAKSKVTPLIR